MFFYLCLLTWVKNNFDMLRFRFQWFGLRDRFHQFGSISSQLIGS